MFFNIFFIKIALIIIKLFYNINNYILLFCLTEPIFYFIILRPFLIYSMSVILWTNRIGCHFLLVNITSLSLPLHFKVSILLLELVVFLVCVLLPSN